MSRKKILYVGGFELPDKNAAAHRVISNAKIFRELGYHIDLLGVSKTKGHNCDFLSEEYEYQNFRYWLIPYPQTIIDWIQYVSSIKHIKEVIERARNSYDMIIAYNFPALALYQLQKYCRKNNIVIVSDCTEWYNHNKNSIVGIIKHMDSEIRMRFLNKKIDGLICISEYLYNYYKDVENKTILPPLVDMNEKKWEVQAIEQPSKIKLIYAGSPGTHKDKINLIVDGLANIDNVHKNVVLNIVGITKDEYFRIYPEQKAQSIFIDRFVVFHGRIPHIATLGLIKKSDFTVFFRDRTRSNMAGFPTKFVESISCGIPVITNKTSDLEKYLKDGYNGFWIDIDDEAKRIKRLEKIINLSQNNIDTMKRITKQSQIFDYRNYIDLIGTFTSKMT